METVLRPSCSLAAAYGAGEIAIKRVSAAALLISKVAAPSPRAKRTLLRTPGQSFWPEKSAGFHDRAVLGDVNPGLGGERDLVKTCVQIRGDDHGGVRPRLRRAFRRRGQVQILRERQRIGRAGLSGSSLRGQRRGRGGESGALLRHAPLEMLAIGARGRGRETEGEQRRGRRASVDADHHVGSLHDRIGGLPDLELQRIDRLVGDGGGQHGAADLDLHMCGGLALASRI